MKDWSFWRVKPCRIPTWRGWLLILSLGLLVATALVMGVQPFLAQNDPIRAEALVVEGWLPDYALKQVKVEFDSHPYERIYVTGAPITKIAWVCAQPTVAHAAAFTLRYIGVDEKKIVVVPSETITKDRTYHTALYLKDWWRQHGVSLKSINLFSLGAHARRSRLLFEKAMGPDIEVGIVAAENEDYPADRWWMTSEGFRDVIGELIAYGYARLLFRENGHSVETTTGGEARMEWRTG